MGKVTNTQEEKEKDYYLKGKIILISYREENTRIRIIERKG